MVRRNPAPCFAIPLPYRRTKSVGMGWEPSRLEHSIVNASIVRRTSALGLRLIGLNYVRKVSGFAKPLGSNDP